jgi:3-ketoacyl-CoA synthase
MKPPSDIQIKLLKLSFLSLLSFTFFLHTTLPYTHYLTHPLSLSFALCALLSLLRFKLTRPRPTLLLNYSCYKPPPHRKCTYKVCEAFVRQSAELTPESIEFMRNIYLKSGLGDQTYAPPFIFHPNTNAMKTSDIVPTLPCAVQEAQEGMFAAVDSLLAKTHVSPDLIDHVIVTCGSFSPSPSLSSHIVNRYKLKPSVKNYNLSGMGCSSGVIAIDLASQILKTTRKVQYALVIITESISLNWYFGDNRSMLVTNCIFRVGCAAALLTTDSSRRGDAKMELVDSVRTHHGADDGAYRAAFQEEDEKGYTGIALTKDLIRVAGVNLREHLKVLAPRVLPLSQLGYYLYSVVAARVAGGEAKPVVPDFMAALEHMCVHTGGKAVIEQVGRVLKLSEEVTEPARMSLHRFGNTSCSLVFYELGYFEAKGRVKRGDRMWMIAFGTGFKVGSLVWRWLCDSTQESDNPWNDCIDEYPLKTW